MIFGILSLLGCALLGFYRLKQLENKLDLIERRFDHVEDVLNALEEFMKENKK